MLCFATCFVASASAVLRRYFAPGEMRSISSACLYVCLSVRSHISKNHTPKLYEIFCKCYLWPWLGAFLATMQYIMYFRFLG